MKSMTGYGQSAGQFLNYRISVELRTVNNRYLDTNIRVYKQYAFVEEMVREEAAAKIKRGKLDVMIQFDNLKKDDRVVTLNADVAAGYYEALKQMADLFSLENDITVSRLSRFPDVFTIEKCEQDKEAILSDVKQVLLCALDDLTAAREREGKRLRTFFEKSIDGMRALVSEIERRAPETVEQFREKIHQRVEEALAGADVDENRLLTEVCLYADKVNITEEIVRFQSHLLEFQNLMESDEPVGRKLDFIIQELNRETNTMGSKCSDYAISKLVVELKSEIEKVREQVQNIE